MIKAALLVASAVAASLAPGQELLRLDANDASTLTLAGDSVAGWRNAVGTQTFTPFAVAPTLVAGVRNGQSAVRFAGGGGLRALDFGASATDLTIVLVAAPRGNTGGYQALLSDSTNGADDYLSGFNVDLTSGPSARFDRVNFEGVKAGGGTGFGGSNLRTGSDPFGEFRILTFTYDAAVTLYVDGEEESSYATANPGASVALDDLRVGSRYYSDTERGYFDGDIAEVRIFGGALDDASRGVVERELGLKYAIPVPEPASLAFVGLGVLGLLRRPRTPRPRGSSR